MTLQEIKSAVDAGLTVRWKNNRYKVIKDRYGDYFTIDVYNLSCIGLCRKDTGELIGNEVEFYIE